MADRQDDSTSAEPATTADTIAQNTDQEIFELVETVIRRVNICVLRSDHRNEAARSKHPVLAKEATYIQSSSSIPEFVYEMWYNSIYQFAWEMESPDPRPETPKEREAAGTKSTISSYEAKDWQAMEPIKALEATEMIATKWQTWVKSQVEHHRNTGLSAKHPNFQERLRTLCSTLLSNRPEILRLDAILDFFTGLSRLFSDLRYITPRKKKVTFRALSSLPSRYDTIQDIVDRAPPIDKLSKSLSDLGFGASNEDHTCGICLSQWETSDWSVAIGDREDDESPAEPWLMRWKEGRQLLVRPGFERVPLKMACGHAFCADCIAKWLESSSDCLSCPYRDWEYGFQASRSVMEFHGWRERLEQDPERYKMD